VISLCYSKEIFIFNNSASLRRCRSLNRKTHSLRIYLTNLMIL